MIARVIAAAIAVAGFPIAAPSETYQIDSQHSVIGFNVHQFFLGTSGRFRQFSGTIRFDRDHPEHSSVSARIEVLSIDTRNESRDNHLRSAEFFDAARFPAITFRSRAVKQTGPQTADVTGDLTMHGVSKSIVLHIKMLGQPTTAESRWEVTTDPIDRRDFRLTFSGATEAVSGVGRDVATKIEIAAVRFDR